MERRWHRASEPREGTMAETPSSQTLSTKLERIAKLAKKVDAERVLDVLPKRFGKYGLALHPDKTANLTPEEPDA